MKSQASLALFGGSIDELVDWTRQAEAAGFESAWVAEFYDRSATIALAAIASATSRITIGSGIAYAFGRTPVVMAAEAKDLDTLSRGRLILGLGTGTKRMMTDWHGLDGTSPAGRVCELVPLLRQLWHLDEGPVHHDGKHYRLHVSPTNPPTPAFRQNIPIFLAGVNSRMVAGVGAVADGLVGHPLYTPNYVTEVVRPTLDDGAAGAGRKDRVKIAGYLICSIGDDPAVARRKAAGQIALYSATRTYAAMLERHGFATEVAAIRSAWSSGNKELMIDSVSDKMIDAIALSGRADEVRERYLAEWDGLYDYTLFYPPTFGGAADVEAIIDTFQMTSE